MAFAAFAPGASRMLERLAPPPEVAEAQSKPARPWRLLVLGCVAMTIGFAHGHASGFYGTPF